MVPSVRQLSPITDGQEEARTANVQMKQKLNVRVSENQNVWNMLLMILIVVSYI